MPLLWTLIQIGHYKVAVDFHVGAAAYNTSRTGHRTHRILDIEHITYWTYNTSHTGHRTHHILDIEHITYST